MMKSSVFCLPSLLGVFLLAGCGKENPPILTATKTTAQHTADEEHGHKPSAHGGLLVPVGRDSYHAEAVFEKGGNLRLYMLGQDETRIQEVDAQQLSAYARIPGSQDSVPFTLQPDPQPGDKSGMTSQFAGKLPRELAMTQVEVTIPNIRIGNERFRIAFGSVEAPNAHGIPPKQEDEAEKRLYLTPGGRYSEKDIKANGEVTASQKFAGVKAEHDLKPKPGDPICPITLTKANDKFSWIVDGKTYTFCCPPCVDEFLAQAKEAKTELKAPDAYRKQ